MSSVRRRPLREIAPAILALLLSFSAAVYLWDTGRSNAERQVRERFETQVKQIAFLILRRFELYAYSLYGTQGLFAADADGVDAGEWEAFTRTEDLRRRYPGLTAVRYAETADGKIWIVKYADPTTLAGSAPPPRALDALDRAAAEGRPAASRPVLEDGDQAISLVLPVYAAATETGAAPKGFVEAALRLRELLQATFLGVGMSPDLRLRIHDGPPDPVNLVYDTHAGKATEPLGERFTAVIPMEVAGRPWTLEFAALNAYFPAAERRLPLFYLAGGMLIGILFSGIVWALSTSRSKAVAFAERMTEDLTREIAERRLADERLQKVVVDLERRNREQSLLGELGELLQSASRPEEAYPIIGRFAAELFPGTKGTLHLMNSSRSLVENVTQWGDALRAERVFGPEDCWALKRGRMHASTPGDAEPVCRHLGTNPPENGYLCVPMMAHGEGLGILYVELLPAALRRDVPPPRPEIAVAVAEQSALALANLRLREALRNQSIRDKVTGLFNRHYMEESLERELARVTRGKEPLGILLLDIDYFKKFNDLYGHDVGDELLSAVGKFLSGRFRGSDIPCRFGGEEFVVILPGATVAEATVIAEAVRAGATSVKVHAGDRIEGVTFSIGVSAFPEHGTAAETLLKSADMALYQAKHDGRDRVRIGQPVV